MLPCFVEFLVHYLRSYFPAVPRISVTRNATDKDNPALKTICKYRKVYPVHHSLSAPVLGGETGPIQPSCFQQPQEALGLHTFSQTVLIVQLCPAPHQHKSTFLEVICKIMVHKPCWVGTQAMKCPRANPNASLQRNTVRVVSNHSPSSKDKGCVFYTGPTLVESSLR